MKLIIIAGLSAFVLSVVATMFLTGTFDRNKGEAIIEEDQNEQKDNKNEIKTKSEISQNTIKVKPAISYDKNEASTLKTELEKYKAEVSAEQAKLSTIKEDVESLKATKSDANKYKQLAKLYSAMKPEDAASVLCELEANLTERILSEMNERTAGKIMGEIASKNPSYAAKVSKIIANSTSSTTGPY
ncbi:MAG: MotE family protein [Candidatus Poribacteria bacterium]